MSNETEATAHRAPTISLDNPFKIQPETATEEGRYEATLSRGAELREMPTLRPARLAVSVNTSRTE